MKETVENVQNKYVDVAVRYKDIYGKHQTLVLRNIPVGLKTLLGSFVGCVIDEVSAPVTFTPFDWGEQED